MKQEENPNHESQLSTAVIRELLMHGDCANRIGELRAISSYINEEEMSEDEAYQLLNALGQLDAKKHPFSKCAEILRSTGISPENLPVIMEGSTNLSKETIALALSSYRELVAEGGLEKADIEHRIREIFGDKCSENDVQHFFGITGKMIEDGQLCYPESFADFNKSLISDVDRDEENDES